MKRINDVTAKISSVPGIINISEIEGTNTYIIADSSTLTGGGDGGDEWDQMNDTRSPYNESGVSN